ncbi:MAG: type 1 glutamine amidotransferase [Endozoicomonadaceae bacterium]|nr:type 1 glutamine amidotransferase [Endozoicomonadaceae bacterium]
MKKIALLACNLPHPKLPGYSNIQIIHDFLNRENIAFDIYPFSCINSDFPENTSDFDGFIINGSPVSCYDNLSWILELEDFIRAAYLDSVPVVGICFGHQVIAQALGGVVEKSKIGFQLGVNVMTLTDSYLPYMPEIEDQLNIFVSYQDQIITLPNEARLLAKTDNCPYFMLKYDRMLTIQGHPELDDYHQKLLINALLEKNIINKPQSILAEKSLKKRTHNAEISKWICRFLSHHDA